MKSLIEFIKCGINESNTKFDIDRLASEINYSCNWGKWKLDSSSTSCSVSFKEAVNDTGSLYDVLKLNNAFTLLADDLGCDEDELMNFIYDNNDELTQKIGELIQKMGIK